MDDHLIEMRKIVFVILVGKHACKIYFNSKVNKMLIAEIITFMSIATISIAPTPLNTKHEVKVLQK